MAQEEDKVQTLMAIAVCDEGFARSFLEASAWDLDTAVRNIMEPGGGTQGDQTRAGSLGNPESDDAQAEDRAPIPQFYDTLVDVDPAQQLPQPTPIGQFKDFIGNSSKT